MIYEGGSGASYSSSIVSKKHFSSHVDSDISYVKLERKIVNLFLSLTCIFFFRLPYILE